MHAKRNPRQNKPHTQPGLLGNNLALNVPFPENGEEECTRIGYGDCEGEFCQEQTSKY